MSVAVLIPWRTTACEHRTRALAWVIAKHAANGWPVIIGRHDHGPWCKAAAIDDALSQTQAEILILADADVWTEGLPEAVGYVRARGAWAIPHRGVLRLSERATDALLATGSYDPGHLAERAYLGVEGGGVLVIRREVYEACPIDPRFLGWGSEDEAHGFAVRSQYGPPRRARASLLHLWHPPQERLTRSRGSWESWQLRKRYAQAIGNPSAMRSLVEEAKANVPCCIVESSGHDCSALVERDC